MPFDGTSFHGRISPTEKVLIRARASAGRSETIFSTFSTLLTWRMIEITTSDEWVTRALASLVNDGTCEKAALVPKTMWVGLDMIVI